MTEVWIDIYPNYRVSNYGRVFSVKKGMASIKEASRSLGYAEASIIACLKEY